MENPKPNASQFSSITPKTSNEKALKRKIVKIGTSAGIVIPKDFLDHIHLEKGDDVNIVLNDKGHIIIQPIPKLEEGLSPQALNIAARVMDKYSQTLKGLKDR